MDSISSSEFVAIFPDSTKGLEKLLEQLRAAIQISPLPGIQHGYLVTLPKPASDAKAEWKKLNKLFDGKAALYPVYRDKENNLHYSVGKMQIRFPSPPTAQELQQLCQAQGLKLAERNAYAPSQVAFQLQDPHAQFLPELLEQVQQDTGDQVKVWPETLTSFKRGI